MNQQPGARPRRGEVVAVVALLVVSTVVRILLVRHLPDQGSFIKYLHFADLQLAGQMPLDRMGDLSAGYFWTVVVLRWFGLSLAAVRDCQIALLSVGIGAITFTAWRLTGRWGAVAATLLLFSNRAALLNATELEPETLIFALHAFVLTLALWPALGKRATLLMGLLLGFSITCRPVALLLFGCVLVWIVYRASGNRTRLIHALLFSTATALPIAAVIVLNSALTGSFLFMNPGMVFYEGTNPYATGYAGVQPRIVNDLEPVVKVPDALHVTYRMVAARAVSPDLSRTEFNRYWTNKALSFLRNDPAAVIQLQLRKLGLALHSYDAWDLVTTIRKSQLMTSPLWMPFGTMLGLAAVACLGWKNSEKWFVVACSVAGMAHLVLFYVTARQRNAVLPALALLSAMGVAAMFRVALERSWFRLSGLAIVGIGVLLLSLVPGIAQEEDLYGWLSVDRSAGWLRLSRVAEERGDRGTARVARARAATYLTSFEPRVPQADLDAAVKAELSGPMTLPRTFDLAIAAARSGRAEEAEGLLQLLIDAGYDPRRENRMTSSPSYHLARIQLARKDIEGARRLLLQADREAPGDLNILTLMGELFGQAEHLAVARRLHDPFSVRLARARALHDIGRRDEALAELEELRRSIPEWVRPLRLAEAIRGGDLYP